MRRAAGLTHCDTEGLTKWAALFKQCQLEADEYAARTFGLGAQLIELLRMYERSEELSDSPDKVCFANTLAIRIKRLEELVRDMPPEDINDYRLKTLRITR